jgi:hypothetical protein
MKRWIEVLPMAALIAICIALAAGTLSHEATAQQERAGGDVILMRCKAVGDFSVTGFSGSSGAPTKQSNSCPEALSLLGKDGFRKEKVSLSEDANFLVFILVR